MGTAKPKPPTTSDEIRDRRNQAVTITEAADYLGVSHRTIRRLISDGKLPAYRVGGIGGAIRVVACDVEAMKRPIRAC